MLSLNSVAAKFYIFTHVVLYFCSIQFLKGNAYSQLQQTYCHFNHNRTGQQCDNLMQQSAA